MQCKICLFVSKSTAGLSRHLTKTHKTTPEDYTIKYLLDGIRPLCVCGCGENTKYADKQYRFNKVVHNHHKPTLGNPMAVATKEKISKKAQNRFSLMSSDQIEKYVKPLQRGLKEYLEKNNALGCSSIP